MDVNELERAGQQLYDALQLVLAKAGDVEMDMGDALQVVGAKEAWNKAKK